MKYVYIIISTLCIYQTTHGFEIPKSSLEVVKSEIETSLKKAQETNDKKLVDKYYAELTELNKKIKKFEREWLQYRRGQLATQSETPEITAEINQIDALLRSSE
ncbi:MAG TPA: hypothetical protein VGT41_06665 [Candidatus Babeliales bacterium]|nr:hypothetical protein [Candidatus Babeliales bacterium]